MKRSILVAFILSAAAACGGGGGGSSGIPDSTVASDLSMEEVVSFCEEMAADYPAREVDCGGTEPEQNGIDPAECADAEPFADTCTATVGDFRDCFGAIYALSDEEFCNLTEIPPECEPLIEGNCL